MNQKCFANIVLVIIATAIIFGSGYALYRQSQKVPAVQPRVVPIVQPQATDTPVVGWQATTTTKKKTALTEEDIIKRAKTYVLEGNADYLSVSSILEYAAKAQLKKVAVQRFYTDATNWTLLTDDVSSMYYRGMHIGITFLTRKSKNVPIIAPADHTQNYPYVLTEESVSFDVTCIASASCRAADLEKYGREYLRSTARQPNVSEMAEMLATMNYAVEYKEIYVVSFSTKCTTSCFEGFDVFVGKDGDILGSRVTQELVVD